jgi:hypothetical protein
MLVAGISRLYEQLKGECMWTWRSCQNIHQESSRIVRSGIQGGAIIKCPLIPSLCSPNTSDVSDQMLVRTECVRQRNKVGLGEMFECDSTDMCLGKFPLVSMGGRAEGLACKDPGARTPIGTSRNFPSLNTPC